MADIAEFRGARRNPSVETLAYAGETPWHGFGEDVGEAQTSEVMIVKAGIDWEAALGDVYGPDMKPIPGWQSVYRVTDNKVFGISRGRYEILQTRDAFAFTDSLLEDGVAKYETAGALYGGAKVWLLMKLTEGMQVGSEEFRNYLLFFNGFDLNTAVTMKLVTERVVCRNTAMIALNEDSLTFRTTHARGVQERLETARAMFKVTTEAQRRLQIMLEATREVKLSESDKETVQEELFGSLDEDTSTRRKNAIEAFQAIYEAERALNGDTAYTMFNAATGYSDHAAIYRGSGAAREENRFRSIAFGTANNFKNKTLEILTDIAPELKEFTRVG